MMKDFKFSLLFLGVVATSLFIAACAKEQEKDSSDLQHETKLSQSKSYNAMVKPKVAKLDFSCDDSSLGNCTGVAYTTRTFTITLTEYPNCTFIVETMYRECPAGYDFKIISFRITNVSPPGNECQAWTIDFNFYNGQPPSVFNNWLADFYKKLVIGISKVLAVEAGIYCNSGNSLKVAGYTEGNCTRTCAYRQDGGLAIRKTPCGTGCCSTVFELCLDVNGNPVITVQSSTTSAGSPCNPNGPTVNCPEGTFYWGFCAQQCSIFN